MNFNDTLEEAKYQFGRFFIPTLFMACAIILLRIALVPVYAELNNGQLLEIKQSSFFLYGAIFFMIASVVWFLYVFGVIKTFVGYGVMAVLLAASCYLLYHDFTTVSNDVAYKAEFEKIEGDIKARLLDLKAAEVAYKEYNHKYTANIDTLIWFVKNGKKMTVPNKGALPGRPITPEERDYIYGDNRPIDRLMTEQEANKLAKMPNPPADLIGFSRDTVYLSVMDAVFKDEKHQTARGKVIPQATLGFHADSLRYVPYSGQKLVSIDTGAVQKGDLRVPTVQISMVHPMNPKIVFQIGDVNDNHLRDNWSK